MTNKERRVFTSVNILISLIGIVYCILKYFFTFETDFGVRPHEYTSTFLHLHIISVPLLLLALGYLFGVHILPKWSAGNPKRSISGVSLIILGFSMTLSGYLLQVALSEPSNNVAAIIHLIASFLWIFIYLWHFRLKF